MPLAAFLGTVVLTVLPWLIHNYAASGHFVFDAPFQYQIIASQYGYSGNLDIENVDLQGKSVLGIVWAFALRDPQFVLGFVSNHFLATQIGSILVLPLIEPYNGLLADMNLYWLNWTGTLTWFNTVLIICYLAIIAVGLGKSWSRLRWAGMLPLVFSLGYSLANGVGRFSGWRYDLPADWSAYFYFGVGGAELFGILGALFGGRAEPRQLPETPTNYPRRARVAGLLAVAGFALNGCACPGSVKESPRRVYSNRSADRVDAAAGLRIIGPC